MTRSDHRCQPTDIEQLTALFRRLGATDPEGWAKSQLEEGINQLHRYLFLRQAWSRVIAEDEQTWIERAIHNAEKDPEAPYSGVGRALAMLLANGALRDDLTDLVRGMQAQLLFDVCYLLDDPSLEEPELADLGWSLVETDGSSNQLLTPSLVCMSLFCKLTLPAAKCVRA